MKILRIETIDGKGPYIGNTNVYYKMNWDTHTDSETHPGPEQDPDLKESWDDTYSFGFKNKKQYKKWFCKKERKLLKEHRFCLATYKDIKKNILIATQQVAFQKCTAVCIKKRIIK